MQVDGKAVWRGAGIITASDEFFESEDDGAIKESTGV